MCVSELKNIDNLYLKNDVILVVLPCNNLKCTIVFP